MSRDIVVRAEGLYKIFDLYSSRKSVLSSLFLPSRKVSRFQALMDVSFQVEQGDVVGVVGVNGSGKSTLMQLIAGISWPTRGDLEVQGEVSLLSVGFGLDPQLNGLENIELKGILLGLSKKRIQAMRDEIVEFADIGEFINQPMKTYSSGMRSRLGFAISICMDPDILIVDEALAVGDGAFIQKCFDRMKKMQESGKTIFYVSHSPSTMKGFCNRMLWLDRGRVQMFDAVEAVLPRYDQFINGMKKLSVEEKKRLKADEEHERIIPRGRA